MTDALVRDSSLFRLAYYSGCVADKTYQEITGLKICATAVS
jgi:hypothetical protein